MSQPTIDQFKDWLRTKDAGESYDYWSTADDATSGCAAMQFIHANGLTGESREGDLALEALHQKAGAPLVRKPWTYGALLSRLEALS